MAENEQSDELVESASQFVHEIKGRLGTLSLNLALLGEDFQDAETPREKRALTKIQKLQAECERLVDVSNEFLRFARSSNLECEPCDLTDVVEELLDFYLPTAQQAGIDIRSHLPADLPPVSLNREMFKQALLNLILNAQQAMPNGGVLTIQANLETSLVPHGPPDGEQNGDGKAEPADVVCLYIIDTGVGMSPEVAAQVFRPFFSARSGGTGLGLPTTRRIIEAHGGTIDLQSAVGRGTRFTIRLPLALPPASAEAGISSRPGSQSVQAGY